MILEPLVHRYERELKGELKKDNENTKKIVTDTGRARRRRMRAADQRCKKGQVECRGATVVTSDWFRVSG